MRFTFKDENSEIINKRMLEEKPTTETVKPKDKQEKRSVVDINVTLNEKIYDFYKQNFIEKESEQPFVPWLREYPIRVNWTFESVWSQHKLMKKMSQRSDFAREKCKQIGLASHSRRFKVIINYEK